MHFSMRITIRIICILMRIPKHFSKCVSHAHCMRFRDAHNGKRIRSASDAFQKCASWLSHFMRIWKRIWNASVMRIKRFKWNGLMRFQMRINVHREGGGGVKNWDFYGDILFEWPQSWTFHICIVHDWDWSINPCEILFSVVVSVVFLVLSVLYVVWLPWPQNNKKLQWN